MAWATDATDQDLAFVDLIATLDAIDPDRQACSTRPKQRGGLLAIAHGVVDIARFAWKHPSLVAATTAAASAGMAVLHQQRAKRQARAPREVKVLVTVHHPR